MKKKSKKKERVIKSLADLKESDLPKEMDGPALIYDPVAHRKAVRESIESHTKPVRPYWP
jgi:hypothetical protein